MSNYITQPAEGIRHLIIEELTRDAQVRGAADATTIQLFHAGREPEFVLDGETARVTGAAVSRVFLPANVSLTVKLAPGDLRVQSLASEISLEAVYGDLRLVELAGVVRVAQVSGELRGDRVADLGVLGRCDGDLRFEAGGNLAVESVGGDVRLGDAADVRLGRVHGDLWAEKLRGGLQLNRGDGDARLSEIAGPVKLQALNGDLRGGGLTGGLAAAKVTGDVSLHGPFTNAEGYTLAAEGDIALDLPADADVRLSVNASGRIRSDPKLTPAADGSPVFTAAVGHGAVRVSLTAGGDLRIRQMGAAAEPGEGEVRRGFRMERTVELGDLGERIRQRVYASLAAAGINVETGEVNLGPRGTRPHKPPRPPAPPERPRPPAPSAATMTDEQLAVLRMVESGKITAAQAELLLKAMGA